MRKVTRSKPIRVVLVGMGRMGRNHLRVMLEDRRFQVVAVVDANSLGIPKEILRGIPLFASFEELRHQSIDAFVVATSTETHFDVLKKCMPYGQPILVEKPLCATTRECKKLIAIARGTSARIVVGHLERFNPVVRKLQEIIRHGWIGRPIHFSFTRVGGYPQNVGSGNDVLVDLAIHDIDIFSRLCGPCSVLASVCHSTVKKRVLDTAEILLVADSGASASVHVNWITPTKIRTIKVTGTKGVAMVDYMLQTCSLIGGDLLGPRVEPRIEFSRLLQAYENTDRIEFGVKKAEPLREQLDHFYRFIRGKMSDCCTPLEAMRVSELAEEAMRYAT